MGPPLPRIRPKSRRHKTYRSCSPAETAGGVYSPRPPKPANTSGVAGAHHPEPSPRRSAARGPGSVHALGSRAELVVWAGRQTTHRHRYLPVS